MSEKKVPFRFKFTLDGEHEGTVVITAEHLGKAQDIFRRNFKTTGFKVDHIDVPSHRGSGLG